MLSRNVIVVNQLGMHARAAAKFVHLATRYHAHVRGARGTTITISADGSDERDAIEALSALVASGFGEDVCGA